MPRGRIEFYNKVRNFGFIIPDDNEEYNFLFNGDYDFVRGDSVEYELSIASEKGPQKAINIRKVENE